MKTVEVLIKHTYDTRTQRSVCMNQQQRGQEVAAFGEEQRDQEVDLFLGDRQRSLIGSRNAVGALLNQLDEIDAKSEQQIAPDKGQENYQVVNK